MEKLNGILFDRTNISLSSESVNKMSMNNSIHMSPKTRPLPTFFFEQTTFSTKKEKETPKVNEIYPPRPPIKSCPPISRLKTAKKLENDRARVISFATNNNTNGNNLLKTGNFQNMFKSFF